MMRMISLLMLAAALVAPAQAQVAPGGFPLDRTFNAVSISGFDVQKMKMTLKVAPNPSGAGVRAAGHAGCNGWNATVTLRDDQIDFANIVTTRKFCGKARMNSEEAFLSSLRSAKRWRLDGDRLIVEGDAARLLLKGGAADAKERAKEPAKPRAAPAKPKRQRPAQ